MEHKYSRTTLWLEYMGSEQTYPVPFNLLPSLTNIKRALSRVANVLGKTNCARKKDESTLLSGISNQKKDMEKSYKVSVYYSYNCVGRNLNAQNRKLRAVKRFARKFQIRR